MTNHPVEKYLRKLRWQKWILSFVALCIAVGFTTLAFILYFDNQSFINSITPLVFAVLILLTLKRVVDATDQEVDLFSRMYAFVQRMKVEQPTELVIAGNYNQYLSYLEETGKTITEARFVTRPEQIAGIHNATFVLVGTFGDNPAIEYVRERFPEAEL